MMFVTYPRELFPSYTMEPRYYDYDNGCMFGGPCSRQLYPNYYYNIQQPNTRIVNGRYGYPSNEFYNEEPVSYRPRRRPARSIRQFNPVVMNNWFQSSPDNSDSENPERSPESAVANPFNVECNDWPENVESRMNSKAPRYLKKKNSGIPIITKSSNSLPDEEELSNTPGQCKLENVQAEDTSLSDRSTSDCITQDMTTDEHPDSNRYSCQKESVENHKTAINHEVENNKTALNNDNALLESSQEETVEKPNESSDVNHTLDQVKDILKETQKLKEQTDQFSGTKGDKQFLYLEEMLTRKLLQLDGIDSHGKEEIRLVRREAVKTVQTALDVLDNKVHQNQGCQMTPENAQKTVDISENVRTGVNTSETDEEAVDYSEVEQSDDTLDMVSTGSDHS